MVIRMIQSWQQKKKKQKKCVEKIPFIQSKIQVKSTISTTYYIIIL